MKNILIPTDFNETSEKAVEFGIEIAKKTGAKIILVNTFFIPVLDINVPPTMVQTLYDSERKKSDEKLRKIKEQICKINDYKNKPLKCELICIQSTPQSEIEMIAEKKNVDLVIMGTKGKEGFLGLWKSITTETAKEINAPLLIVKEDTDLKEFKKIDFAIENVREEFHAIKVLADFAKIFNSEIIIVHVEKNPKNNEKEISRIVELTEETENFVRAIREFSEYPSITYRTIFNDDTPDGLLEYLNRTNGDLLGVIRYERNWLENIFHKSVIKNLISESSKPLLVIPRR